jgi:triphosphatase
VEAELPNELPSYEELRTTPAAKLIRHDTDLHPVFSLNIDRRNWTLSRDGATVEVALDTGTAIAEDQSQAIHEAELELKAGPPQLLFALAEDTCGCLDAPLSFVSKGVRGYRLATKHATTPEHSLDLHLEPSISVKAAFQKIAGACLRQFSINEEYFRKTDDPEAIHQARVAIRRLRAAFSMFKTVVVGDDADEVRKGLKWISDFLGEARDLDVFFDAQLRKVELEHPGVPGLKALAEKASSIRAAAHDRVSEAIHSEQFRRLLLSVARCIQIGEWTRIDAAGLLFQHEKRFLEFAKSELDRRYGSVTKKKKAMRGANALKRHQIRIKAKKLRYMAEFLRPLVAGRAYSRTSAGLKRLQDLLGALNDVIAAERLLGQVVEEVRDPGVNFAAGLIRQYGTISRETLIEASRVQRKLRRSEPFWAGLQE